MENIELQNQQYRRDILSCLHQDGDFTMNEVALNTALRYLGNPIASSVLRTQLAWLNQQGFITLSEPKGIGMFVARLTKEGMDVSEGLLTVYGIAEMPL